MWIELNVEFEIVINLDFETLERKLEHNFKWMERKMYLGPSQGWGSKKIESRILIGLLFANNIYLKQI